MKVDHVDRNGVFIVSHEETAKILGQDRDPVLVLLRLLDKEQLSDDELAAKSGINLLEVVRLMSKARYLGLVCPGHDVRGVS